MVASGIGQPQGLATDGTNVYWTDGKTSLLKVSANGGGEGAAPATVTSALSSPTAFVLAGRTAYVTNQAFLSSTVTSVDLDTGATTAVPVPPGVSATATDGTTLYYAATVLGCADAGLCLTSLIMRYAPGDTAPTQVATPPAYLDDFVVNAPDIYVAVRSGSEDQSPDDVLSMPVDGGTSVTLASTVGVSVQFALTSGSVYWTDGVTVWSIPRGGGAVTVVHSQDATQPVRVSLLAGDTGGAFAIVNTDSGDTALVPMGP